MHMYRNLMKHTEVSSGTVMFLVLGKHLEIKGFKLDRKAPAYTNVDP